jgi:hypothetical protein
MLVQMDEEAFETLDLGVISRMSDALLYLSWNEAHDIITGYESRTVGAEGGLSFVAFDKCLFGPAWSGRGCTEDVITRWCS